MENVFKSSKTQPTNIQSDAGKEFYNSKFMSLMKKYRINHYSTYSNTKASIVERFNRTLKTKMWKAFSLRGNYKFLDILPTLVKEYNSSFHKTIGMRLIDLKSKKVESYLLTKMRTSNKTSNKQRFNKGDFVRISKQKALFSKGYTPYWTAEIFRISKVQNTVPYTYLLNDSSGQPISDSFYNEELQKVKHPNIYLIERKKRKQVICKISWLEGKVLD